MNHYKREFNCIKSLKIPIGILISDVPYSYLNRTELPYPSSIQKWTNVRENGIKQELTSIYFYPKGCGLFLFIAI